MKKEYMKPDMQVVKIQRHGIICSSPNGYNDNSDAVKVKNSYIDDENDII